MTTQKMTFVPAAGGSVQHVTGCTHLTKMTPAVSGAFSAMLAEVPVECGPPMHYHEHDAEWAFVLHGQVTFESRDAVVVAGPGDSVFLPAGQSHAFRNTGTETARMLVVVTPGQAHAFFTEVDAALHGEVVPKVLVEIASRHGIRFGVAPQGAREAA